MMKPALTAIMALAFASTAWACSCAGYDTLESCTVNENKVAMHVRGVSSSVESCPGEDLGDDIITLDEDISIMVVEIIEVFKDNTGLGLAAGEQVLVGSNTNAGECGYRTQDGVEYILFGSHPPDNDEVEVEEEAECVLPTTPLRTGLCSGNVYNPTPLQLQQIRGGCVAGELERQKEECRVLLGLDGGWTTPPGVDKVGL